MQLCCPEKDTKTLKARTDKGQSFRAGDLIRVGSAIGLVADGVSEKSDFILVYEAAKVRVFKEQGVVFKVGDRVYVDGRDWNYPHLSVTPEKYYGKVERTACGIVLEAAKAHDDSVLIDLMVLA